MIVGAVVVVLVLLVALPAVWWAIYALMAVLLGWLLTDHAEATHEGSELISTNV